MRSRSGPAAEAHANGRSLPHGASTATVLVLIAGVLLTTMLGSIHAFSVFLETFETTLGVTRARVSLIYSGALVCLTIAVLLGHHLYQRWSAPTLTTVATLGAAAGVAVAGLSTNYWLTLLGYSMVFGGANGVGYGYALQFSAQALPRRQGFAMGLVTAFYAFGAAVAPFLFDAGLTRVGLQQTLLLTATTFVVLGSAATALVKRSGFSFRVERQTPAAETSASDRRPSPASSGVPNTTALLWLGYGAGALSGLMVIGHATGIVESVGGSTGLVVGTTAAMALGNMAGGLGAGALTDRVPIIWLLLGLPAVSAIVVVGSSAVNDPAVLALGLVAVGLIYGAIIAVYPVAVLLVAGPHQSAKLYGRVFTSWGVAGLFGPWLAGVLFDSTGSYTIPLLVAGGFGVISAAAALGLSETVATT